MIRGMLDDFRDVAPGTNISVEASLLGVGLDKPKGLHIMEDEGIVLVADVGLKEIRGFAMQGSEEEAEFIVEDLGADRAAWDVTYDAKSDTMWGAGTDGTAILYEKFSDTLGEDGPDAEIIPADDGEQISINLHGIIYLQDSDTLLLKDVGSAQVADDGQFFLIQKASKADDLTDVDGRLQGDLTGLGNPVDLEYANGSIYVAEKAQDTVMRFDNILSLSGTKNISPEEKTTLLKAESVHVIETK